jgi:hypothetical protein
MVHIATDGETYGHHHPFGEMALAYALHSIESGGQARLTNHGEFLEQHPPTHAVEIWDNRSWSCTHGIGRWSEDCGCSTGAHPGWKQGWRAPLRNALDWLRDTLGGLYAAGAAGVLKDPWIARDDYIDVILDRSRESLDRFLAAHHSHELSVDERIRVLKLLELQRHAMLMYTSCGWFFDDISRIEAIQILQYAGRAIELGEDLSGRDDIETGFMQMLANAQSNDPEFGDGRDIYRKFVKPAMIVKHKAASQYAVRSLFEDFPERSEFYSYIVDRQCSRKAACGKSKLVIGRCTITSGITQESSEAEYAVMHLGEGNISGKARECKGIYAGEKLVDEIVGAFQNNDFSAAFRLMDSHFGQTAFALDSLFLDERQNVLEILLREANAEMERSSREAFERMAPLVRSLKKLGMEAPAPFHSVAELVLRAQLLQALQSDDLNTDDVMQLLEEVKFWQVEPDRKELEDTLRRAIENRAKESRDNPGNLKQLKKLAAAVDLASRLSFDINYYHTQNIYYELLQGGYTQIQLLAEGGDKNASRWVEEFRDLGKKLSVRID